MRTVDARGLRCPLPLVKAKLALEEVAPGEAVRVLATDPEAPIDLAAWAGGQGHEFEELGPGEYVVRRASLP